MRKIKIKIRQVKERSNTFIRKASYGAFPRVVNAVGKGHRSVEAIAKYTGMLKGVVSPMVKFAEGIWINKTKDGLVITAEGEKIIKKSYTPDLRKLDIGKSRSLPKGFDTGLSQKTIKKLRL